MKQDKNKDEKLKQNKDISKDKDIKTNKDGNQKGKNSSGKGPLAYFKSNRFKRGGMSAVMTIIFVALIVLVNVLTGLLSDRFPSINIDMTAQGLNTLSEDSLDAAKNVEKDTRIIFLSAESTARQDSYLVQVVNLAERMNEVNRMITVEFKDLDENPTLQKDEFPNETLSAGDVIVQSGERYRYLSYNGDLFYAQTNSTTGASEVYSQADGVLANALVSVNSDTSAKVAFVTGHSEALPSDYRADFESLLSDQLYDVEEFNILTDDIPEDANVVMIPAPTTDFTQEEIEKLRTYLADSSGEFDRTVVYVAYPNINTPNLSEFLEEWGVSVETGYVTETDTTRLVANNLTYLLVNNTSTLLEDNSYPYLASPMSAPLNILFDYNDDISVSALWTSADTSYITIDQDTNPEETGTKGLVTATLSRKQMASDGSKYANIAVFGSAYAFLGDFANNNTFSNKSFYTDLLSELTGIEPTETYVESVTTSTTDIAADAATMRFMGLYVFTIAIPILIAVIGLFIFFRRRHT